MTLYYSNSTGNFYDTEVKYASYPNDLIEVSKEKHQYLLEQTHMHGKAIVVVNGELTLQDAKLPDPTWEHVKQIRTKRLANTDYTDTLSFKTRVKDSKYTAWQNYRQALRDIPQTFKNTSDVVWPIEPK